MHNHYLAIDIGASGGRHILGTFKDGQIILEEIYRFTNEMKTKDNHLCWDFKYLFEQILLGLEKCGQRGKVPVTMGIDTWGVDFVLLDKNDQVLGDTIAYRDSRTSGMDGELCKLIREDTLYQRTGIQKQLFNTIYQLLALKQTEKGIFDRAERFLMAPEYLNFLLTGVKFNEYTNATTTGMVDAAKKTWDRPLIDLLGIKQALFGDLKMPKTPLGPLQKAIQQRVGFNCEVVLPPTHDTASAVLAVPLADSHSLFISSGTWSLVGLEKAEADCRETSRLANFTNEGGYDYRYRYLKNIMGLWIIQSVKKELGDRYSFSELCAMAEVEKDFPSLIDVNDHAFLAPPNMVMAMQEFCRQRGLPVPTRPGEVASCVYRSLAQSYRDAVLEIESLQDIKIGTIHIVGGGSQADYLNELTARYTGKQILAGPVEATAIGNILSQMLGAGEFETLSQARKAIADSFPISKW
ncbi:MAG TPA: rhamnulokinase [Firmicutes bacterium]|jgi:rhamnulokinase|nr:rhamnulokinase [Bacillota bacterium]